MSYNIYKSDGSPVSIPNDIVYQSFNNSLANGGKGIGVQIVGLGSANYVVPTAQNFLQITENFCSATMPLDTRALQGQLWFNKTSATSGVLYVRVSSAQSGGLANWQHVLMGNTSVTPGSYSSANITVNAQGRITSASNGIGGGGTVTSIDLTSTSLNVSGGPVTASGSITVNLPTQGGVTPGAYTNTSITVDAQGRITSIANGSIDAGGTVTNVSVANVNGISGIVSTPSTTPVITLSLGNITPTTVAATGSVTGANLSGTNTGDQTLNDLLPSQAGNAGKSLVTDGNNASWSDNTGFVPYYIPISTTFTVPLYKQALFSIPIINDGTMIIDGFLVGV